MSFLGCYITVLVVNRAEGLDLPLNANITVFLLQFIMIFLISSFNTF